MFANLTSGVRRFVQAGFAMAAMGAFAAPALAWNTSTVGPTPQDVIIGQQGGTVGVTYVAETGEQWPVGGTINWSVINTSGGANVDTSFGNPCVDSSGSANVGPNYASSICQFRVTTTTGTIRLQATSNVPNTSTVTFDVNVVPPTLTINDVSSNEGNSGTSTQTFTVSLNAPAGPGGVTFNLATANGTATTANGDYIPGGPQAFTIPAGQTSQTYSVTVSGDVRYETNETYFVNVSGVSGATVGDSQGQGTILNDDAPPSLAISDASVTEGNSGTTTATFTVTKTGSTDVTATVNYATADGTAEESDADYVSASGTLTFLAGETSKTISVTVNGDTAIEPNETFFVNLSGASAATIADNQGVGTIANDDAAPVIVVNPATVSGGTVGTAYSQSFTASGGTAPYTFAISAGALPAGLAFSTGGSLTGTPTAAGTYSFNVQATDDDSYTGTRSYTLVVAPPIIVVAPTTLPNGTVAAAYSQNVTASGGIGPYSYAVTAGAIPAGLTFSTSGTLSGTPTAGGTFNFTVTATGSSTGTGSPHTGARAYALVINPPTVSLPATTLPNGLQGSAYTQALNPASGGVSPYTYGLTAGVLPPGITLNASSGTLSGTPTASGTFNFAVVATDSSTGTGPYNSAPRSYALTVTTPTTVSIGNAGGFEGNSGTSFYTFTVSLNAPSSQTVTVAYGTNDGSATTVDNDYEAASGLLTFAPGETSKSINVTVNGDTKFEINEAFTVVLSSPTNAALGTATGSGVINNDDTQPSASVSDVSLNEGNSGTTNFPFVITLSNASYQSITIPYDTANNTAGAPGDFTALNSSVTFAPGETTKTINVAVNGDAAIEPNETFFFNIYTFVGGTISDNQGVGTIQNDDTPVDITTLTLPSGAAGANYANSIATTGGLAPIGFSLATGDMPPGLTLNTANGLISGTPTAVGAYTFSINAADSNTPQTNDTQSYTLTITAPLITVNPSANPPNGNVGVAYNQAITASGGNGPYSYAITAGSLPAGLVLGTASGTLSGTPTAGGTFNFTVTATDETTGSGAPFSGSRNYTLIINAPTITLAPLGNGQIGVAYNGNVAALGGTAPYSYAVTAGALPAGLVLGTASGTITGTPTASGTFSFTIAATDESTGTGAPYSGSRAYTINITGPALTFVPTSLTGMTVGQIYSQQVTAGGGTAPYSYFMYGGTVLPPGLSLSSTGEITGTPTAGGSFAFTIAATDSSTGAGPFTVARAYNVTVAAPTVTVTPTTVPNATQFSSYSQALSATGGTAPYTFSLIGGALPAGITLGSDGMLSGTPTASGSFNFTVSVTDSSTGSGPYFGAQAYTLVVNQAPPSIASIAPTSGPTAGGQSVAITGANFYTVTSVTFGGTAATYTVNSPTSINVTTPAHAEGPVDVVIVAGGGTATATNGYTYISPGLVRFVVNNPDGGTYVFSSITSALNFTIDATGGQGQSANISLAPGPYSVSFTTPTGTGIAAASCSPAASTMNALARTASLVIASNVTTVCTIDAVPSRRVAVETIGTTLQTQSALIISNAPTLSRRLDRLNGSGSAEGAASAFGKTFASNLPFSAAIGADEIRFSASLSGIRRLANESHTFTAANENGVPASLAASVTPASGLAATAAADATASMTKRSGPRFDIWVEGLLAEFDAAANSDGHFAIVHAGADYLLTDNLLVGVGIQGDWLDMNTASGEVNSRGWLAGPYATARLSEKLYLDARAAWGKATMQVSPFGTYTDKVGSTRELYSAALIGEFELGDLTIRPEGRVTWYKETTEAYVDSLSVLIPSVEIETGELSFGPDFEWTLKQENGGVFMPKIGFDLIWTFQQENTATAFTNAPGLDDTGIRGRIEAGASYIDPRGVEFGGGLFYDGIGSDDYSAWGGTLRVRFGF